jgi:hypothetical protein
MMMVKAGAWRILMASSASSNFFYHKIHPYFIYMCKEFARAKSMEEGLSMEEDGHGGTGRIAWAPSTLVVDAKYAIRLEHIHLFCLI